MCSSISRNICYQILQENKNVFTLAQNISLYQPTKSTATSFAQISEEIVYHYGNEARKISNIPGNFTSLPDLPISWDFHCMVSLENGNLFVMNGRYNNDYKLDTYYYDLNITSGWDVRIYKYFQFLLPFFTLSVIFIYLIEV